jgi:hypothetical protein
MLTIESATNPVYANAEGTNITLQVKFEEFEEIMPFGATPFDPMPYGIELYSRALNGEFGAIAPFVAPVIPAEGQPTTVGAQTL